MQRPTCSGSSSMLTPSASSRSAEPQRLVLERLPCLATAQPAAGGDQRRRGRDVEGRGAAAGPGGVDQVLARGLDRGRERAHRPRQADQLGHRLPLRPQGDQEGAGLDLVAAPLHDLGQHRGGVVGGQVVAGADRVDRPGDDVVRHRVVLPEEVLQQVLALRGQHRLGVELDALGRQLAVAGAHHHVAEAGAQLELVGQLGVGDQRVVAAGDQRARQAGVDRPPVVLDLGVLAVDRLALHGAAAERLDQRLVAEADPQHRRPRLGEGADRLDRDAGLGRRAGAGRDDEAVGAAPEQLVDRGAVVADHLDLRPQLAQVLDQVVGEAVVVVDDEDLHRLLRPVRLLAGQLDGAEDRLRLVDRLVVLVGRLGVGDGAAARLDVDLAVLDDDGADVDRGVEVAVPGEVADRAAVGAALDRLQLVDDLHRPHLGRAGERAGGQRRAQHVHRPDPLAQRARDLADDVQDVRVGLDHHQLVDADRAVLADPAEVVAAEVDQHHVLGPLLGVVDSRSARRRSSSSSLPRG